MGDASQLHQIIMNLCTNAAHAMGDRGGKLNLNQQEVIVDRIYASRNTDLKAGRYLKLTVQDNGCGMTPTQLDHIFEPFYTTKEKGEGTGLGLSVIHGIVKNHGGTIKVYSEPGVGSSFDVYLPAWELAAPSVAKKERPLPRGNERVLVLDDEPSIAKVTSQMLTALGYDVTSCTSTSEALERFEAQPDAFDLIVSDMTMPQMTGDQLARRMMAIRPEIPVILCSGFTKQITRSGAKAMGVRALLTKPLFQRELANTVRSVLDVDGR
jgi:CheY-like chemotaxis protein/anti-sigma regulatory factor (Ser/Thr protein kinase)